jgi:hypothetical protein
VRPAQGRLGQDYQRAVAEFRQEHYRSALPAFQRAAAATAHDPSVQQHVDGSRQAIAAGRDRTPVLLPGGVPPLALGGGVALLAGAAGLVVLRRRRRGSDVW